VLPRVAERRVAEIVGEADRFDEILVQAQRARGRARDLCDLERVREPRAVMIALVVDEDLRLVDQAAESRRVDDAVAVALKLAAVARRWLGHEAAARAGRVRGVGGERASRLAHAFPCAARTPLMSRSSGARATTPAPMASSSTSLRPFWSAFLSSCISD